MVLYQAILNALSVGSCTHGFGSNCWAPQTSIIGPDLEPGNAKFITKGNQGPWDGPKASIINSTDFEWWYFDANSKSGDQGVAAWFMNANPRVWGLDLPHPSFFFFHGRFEDGTAIDTVVPAEQAIINTNGEGSSGLWAGAGSGWTGTGDLSKYSFFFDVPGKEIKGMVDFVPTAEPRSAVKPASDTSADLMNVGGMGWAITAPAGRAIAHVTVGDKVVSFSDGNAYHDHNWGNSLPPWLNWYAIRAEVGPYVWTAIESYKGPKQGSFKNSYLTKNGKTILASFDESSLIIRPWGNGSEYPPVGFDPQPLGATIQFNAGDEGNFWFNLTNHGISPGLPIARGLAKWFGGVVGGKIGEDPYNGQGMFEWLDIAI